METTLPISVLIRCVQLRFDNYLINEYDDVTKTLCRRIE